MIRALLLLAFLGSCLASGGHYPHKTYCYQCEYVPEKYVTKTVYDTEEYEVKIPHTSVHCWYKFEFQGEASEISARPEQDCTQHRPSCEHETTYEVIKKTRQVPRVVTEVIKAGGFEGCKGPITRASAAKYGVDVWDCPSNCYVRENHEGRITRGCYKHESNVDPNLLGCHDQAGEKYCFCQGHYCNHK